MDSDGKREREQREREHMKNLVEVWVYFLSLCVAPAWVCGGGLVGWAMSGTLGVGLVLLLFPVVMALLMHLGMVSIRRKFPAK